MRSRPMRGTPMQSFSDRRNGGKIMRSGKETGKAKAEMVRTKGKGEVKPVVAKEVLPKEDVAPPCLIFDGEAARGIVITHSVRKYGRKSSGGQARAALNAREPCVPPAGPRLVAVQYACLPARGPRVV